jgi:6-phospho-3-hexuloisomerase
MDKDSTFAAYEETKKMVLAELDAALSAVNPADIRRLIDAVAQTDQVFFVGVGRVLLSLEAIAKRWAHIGIRTHVVGEIAEPAITKNDLLIVGSGSGETVYPLEIAKIAHRLGAPVIHIGSNPNSGLAGIVVFMVRIPVRSKKYLPDEIDSQQPMTSLGDIMAKMIIEEKSSA